MKNREKQDLKAYLDEARTWETDRVREIERSKAIAWWIAGLAGVTTMMSVGAVAALAPLKTSEPYVIRVDNATGIVDVVEALTDGRTNYNEAVNKYFTQLYVRYREGYSKELAEEYYNNVGILSGSVEQQKYYQFFNPKNAQSPLNIYGPHAKVRVRIKGTTFIKNNVALVRYTKDIERGADKPQVTHWSATITFKYTKAPMAEKDRAVNPLGFLVAEYRNDPDAPGLEPALQAAQAPAALPPAAPVTLFPAAPAPLASPHAAPAVPAIRQ
ncbi:virB8 family protein [Noviherbaspirillum sp.]|uniref:virB8 family protein n=1 Tax=Noviherbaspirillum sp. TaxID=1926288 RepID=UPI002FE1473C